LEKEEALFDVREAGEADAGHIFGATFLPRRQIEVRIGDLVHRRTTPIVVYDEGGPRAALAAATLKRLGYSAVSVLEGGIAGRELSQGSNVPSKLFGEEVYEHERVPQLPVAQLKAWRDAGRAHMVCDIRTPDEYEVSRIPGAYGAFGVDLARVAGDLREKNVPIVVHCAGRTRSIIACQTLRALGVKDVHALENGTMGWQLAGLELEKGPATGVLQPSPASREDGEKRARALAEAAGARPVDAAELENLLALRAKGERNAYLFDIRQLAEYVGGHIEGSLAVPGGLLIQRTDEFAPVRAAVTVLVDDREARAWLAAYWLRRSGRPDVRVLSGGLEGWRASGRKVVEGRGRSKPLGLDEARKAPRISVQDLAKDNDALVVNVDTSRNYKKARVPGSKWIPYGSLEPRLASTKTSVVLTCHDGRLSALAAANLARIGHPSARVLEGGVDAWAKAGQPVESGWPKDLPAANDLVVPPYHSSLESMARYLEWEQKLTAGRRAANQ
jgi:rhodanese-related sulfurtransferase